MLLLNSNFQASKEIANAFTASFICRRLVASGCPLLVEIWMLIFLSIFMNKIFVIFSSVLCSSEEKLLNILTTDILSEPLYESSNSNKVSDSFRYFP